MEGLFANEITPFSGNESLGVFPQEDFNILASNVSTSESLSSNVFLDSDLVEEFSSPDSISNEIVSNSIEDDLLTGNHLSNDVVDDLLRSEIVVNGIEDDLLTSVASSQAIADDSNVVLRINTFVPSQFDSNSGVFTVGDGGIINVDFLADGSKYEGELGVFSLEGMESFEPNSTEFIREAATRASSNSELGHTVIRDRTSGAKFSGVLGQHEKKDWNKGEYLGVKNFGMRPGDKFALIFVPHGQIENLRDYPNQTGAKFPLFSLTTINTEDNFPTLRLADIGADRQTFAIDESLRSDSDYNDLVFRIGGATGNAVFVDEVNDPNLDWRNLEDFPELVEEIFEPIDLAGSTPDEAKAAFPSTAGKNSLGWLDSDDTDDYYRFSLGMRNEFNLTLDRLNADANVELSDLDGNIVFSSTNADITPESISGFLNGGAYRLRVYSADNASTPYKLNLSVKPTIEGITTTASEEPGFLHTAQSLPLIGVDEFRSGDPLRNSRPEYAGIDGSGFSTVVIDTGIDLDHPFFGADSNNDGVSDRIVFHSDFADNDNNGQDLVTTLADAGHGSNVASIVASGDPNTPGVAPAANIIALKVFTEDGNDADNGADNIGAWTEQALQWVVRNYAAFNIASVNLSLGGNRNFNNPEPNGFLSDEIAKLIERNVVVVASAGNNYFTLGSQQGVNYPAADPNTIGVGAVFDQSFGQFGRFDDLDGDGIPETLRDDIAAAAYNTNVDRITPFSQRHPLLTDIFAPGALINGADENGGANPWSGTSQAAPHISGMAILAQQLARQEFGRSMIPAEFRQWLTSTSDLIVDGDDENDNVVNTGLTFPRANMLRLADRIFQIANPPEPPPPPPPPSIFVTTTITRVRGDFDPGKERRGRGLRRGNSDFYTVISIDNFPEYRSPTKVGKNDYFPLDWSLKVNTINPIVPITIKLFDDDRGLFNDDDHVRIDPNPNSDKDLNLFFNWQTNEIFGDVVGIAGQELEVQGYRSKGIINFIINSSTI